MIGLQPLTLLPSVAWCLPRGWHTVPHPPGPPSGGVCSILFSTLPVRSIWTYTSTANVFFAFHRAASNLHCTSFQTSFLSTISASSLPRHGFPPPLSCARWKLSFSSMLLCANSLGPIPSSAPPHLALIPNGFLATRAHCQTSFPLRPTVADIAFESST